MPIGDHFYCMDPEERDVFVLSWQEGNVQVGERLISRFPHKLGKLWVHLTQSLFLNQHWKYLLN